MSPAHTQPNYVTAMKTSIRKAPARVAARVAALTDAPPVPTPARVAALTDAPPVPTPALTDAPPVPTPALTDAPPAPVFSADNPAPRPDVPYIDERGLPIPASVDETLVKILSSRRRHGSPGEREFMTWLALQIEKRCGRAPDTRAGGNLAVAVLRENGTQSTTLFCAHCDTQHRGGAAMTQGLSYDPSFGHVFLDDESRRPDLGNVLGADDGAGVWLLLEMIAAKVPGTYFFIRGEEVGFVGAAAALKNDRAWLGEFEAAVGFDRPYATDVVTHQSGRECASRKYTDALAAALNRKAPLGLKSTANAGSTDTGQFNKVIAECVNVSVGYQRHHSADEWLDYSYLCGLRDAVVAIEWDALPIDRDPLQSDLDWSSGSWWGKSKAALGAPASPKKAKPKKPAPAPVVDAVDDIHGMPFTEIVDWVESDPETAAETIVELAAEVESLRTKVQFFKEALRGR